MEIYTKCEIGIGVVLKDISRKYKCSSHHTHQIAALYMQTDAQF
jgi:Mor family transcriptional regulator